MHVASKKKKKKKDQMTFLKGEMLLASGQHPFIASSKGGRCGLAPALSFPHLRVSCLQHTHSLFPYLGVFSPRMSKRPGTTPQGRCLMRMRASMHPKPGAKNIHRRFIHIVPNQKKKTTLKPINRRMKI